MNIHLFITRGSQCSRQGGTLTSQPPAGTSHKLNAVVGFGAKPQKLDAVAGLGAEPRKLDAVAGLGAEPRKF
jgi:hypothetical protein